MSIGVRELTKSLRTPDLSGGIVVHAPALTTREIFRHFWPYTRGYRRWMLLGVAFAAVGPLTATLVIWMFKIVIDEVVVPGDFGPFLWVALAYAGLLLVDGAVGFAESCSASYVAGRFLLDLRTKVLAHLQTLSLDVFDRRRLGDLIARLSSDVAAIESLMLSGATRLFSRLFSVVLFVTALFLLRWELALASVLVAPIFLLVSHRFSRSIKRAARERRRHSAAITAIAEESISNIAVTQAYNRQDAEVERFREQGERNLSAQLYSTRLEASFRPAIDTIELAAALLVLGLGTWQIRDGRMTLGALLAFMTFLARLYSPLKSLARWRNTVAAASAGAERVIELLNERPSVTDAPDAPPLSISEGRIEVDRVSFAYPGAEAPAVRDISIAVAPRTTVALVGPSGSGKSTLAKLLVRFYDPDSGALRMDGQDLRGVTVASLRDHVTLLLQETLIFDGTIAENIRYGRPDATDEEIRAAAAAADADGFIDDLPDGYETQVGQRGRRLSGGQRQRIAIARAFIRDAPILVLDEPTTGLDAAATDRVLAPLRRLMDGRTTVVISHNLVSTAWADQIVVLDKGRVVGAGTHDELIAGCELYRGLFALHRHAPGEPLAELPPAPRTGLPGLAGELAAVAAPAHGEVDDDGWADGVDLIPSWWEDVPSWWDEDFRDALPSPAANGRLPSHDQKEVARQP